MGRIQRYLTVGLCLLTGCGSAMGERATGFEMELGLLTEENSEDSNSESEILTLDGGKGHYEWNYGGYHPDENFVTEKSRDFELTDEEVEGLKLYIKDHQLNQDLEEIQSMGEMGRSVEMYLDLTINGVESKIKIEGMSDIWGSGDGGTNLENFATIEEVQDLIYTIKDLGGLYEED